MTEDGRRRRTMTGDMSDAQTMVEVHDGGASGGVRRRASKKVSILLNRAKSEQTYRENDMRQDSAYERMMCTDRRYEEGVRA